MNKKDVESIGYILCYSKCFEEIKERLCALDARIAVEYAEFKIMSGRAEAIDEKVAALMSARYGHNWALLREKPPYGAVLEEVRREFYGDDYEYIFSDRNGKR